MYNCPMIIHREVSASSRDTRFERKGLLILRLVGVSDLIVAGAVRLDQTRLDGQNVYWLEGRLGEDGRNVLT